MQGRGLQDESEEGDDEIGSHGRLDTWRVLVRWIDRVLNNEIVVRGLPSECVERCESGDWSEDEYRSEATKKTVLAIYELCTAEQGSAQILETLSCMTTVVTSLHDYTA